MAQLMHFPRIIGIYSSIRAIQSRSKSVEMVGGEVTGTALACTVFSTEIENVTLQS